MDMCIEQMSIASSAELQERDAREHPLCRTAKLHVTQHSGTIWMHSETDAQRFISENYCRMA